MSSKMTKLEEYGPWKLGSCLGIHDLGQIFKGLNKETGEIVSIYKIPFKNLNSVKNISSTDFITIIQTIKTENFWIIILENLENGSLWDLVLEYGSLNENLASNYARQILGGLSKLESCDLQHGNLKSQNIQTRNDGSICISYFGITEVKNNDIWSLGCIVLEMITGLKNSYNLKSCNLSGIPNNASPLLLDFIEKCWIKKGSEKLSATQLLLHPWISSYNRKAHVSWDVPFPEKVLKRSKSIDLDRNSSVTFTRSNQSLDLDHPSVKSLKKTLMNKKTLFESAFEGDFQSIKSAVEAKQSTVKSVDEDGRTLLHWACSGKHLHIVEYLVSKGSEIDAQDGSDWTPLMIAVSVGDLNITKFLVTAGANVNHSNSSKQTICHYVASKNRLEIAELLLQNGLQVNGRDKMNQTPLHRAAISGHSAMIKVLIAHKAQINPADREGNTPLHLACENLQGDAALTLLELDADPNVQNKQEQKPMDMTNDPKILSFLKKYID